MDPTSHLLLRPFTLLAAFGTTVALLREPGAHRFISEGLGHTRWLPPLSVLQNRFQFCSGP